VLVLACIAGCSSYGDGNSPPSTDLAITVWPAGKAGASRGWTLQCDPNGGTLPNRDRACEQLGATDSPFARPPRDALCTEIYGGPAVAEITGIRQGRRIDAQFTRVDGCEIARWDRHAFLFPVKPAPS
jgi:hypothetical protein